MNKNQHIINNSILDQNTSIINYVDFVTFPGCRIIESWETIHDQKFVMCAGFKKALFQIVSTCPR